MSKPITLAYEPTWSMPEEMREDVPLQWKLAAKQLASQFYRVICDHWDGSSDTLQVRVFRDKDTVNPNWYEVIKSNGTMYRKDVQRAGVGILWPVYPEKDAQVSPPVTVARRRSRPVHRVGEVTTDRHGDTFHSLCVQRTEVQDDLRHLELKFLKDPSPAYVQKMHDLRKRMTEIEMQIVVCSLADGLKAL
jgi:hypothetical protein